VQTHSFIRSAASQQIPRPRHRDEREREAASLFNDLLDARRRSNLNRVRHHLAGLARIGYTVEDLDAVGFRLVNTRATVLPMRSPMPVAWFARLTRALAEGDHNLEAKALDELSRAGFDVTVARENRKGVAR
jgi:hypothetical protein